VIAKSVAIVAAANKDRTADHYGGGQKCIGYDANVLKMRYDNRIMMQVVVPQGTYTIGDPQKRLATVVLKDDRKRARFAEAARAPPLGRVARTICAIEEAPLARDSAPAKLACPGSTG